VFLQGTSTGGSVALQLAVDRPDLVARLVLVASACRLGPRGREAQAQMARLTTAGRGAEAWAGLMTSMLPRPLRGPAGPLSRLAVRSMPPDDPTDLLVTLDAEDAFDIADQLGRVTAPTLVIGGGRDGFYTRSCSRPPPPGVRDGRVHIFEGWGHARTSGSGATTHLTLGFLLAGLPLRPEH
jgi:pimeloyl-ACP methyl ester carboxylesterase